MIARKKQKLMLHQPLAFQDKIKIPIGQLRAESLFSTLCPDILFAIMSFFAFHEQFLYRGISRNHYQKLDITESLTRSNFKRIAACRPSYFAFSNIYPCFIRMFTLLWVQPKIFHSLSVIDLRGFGEREYKFLYEMNACFPITLQEFWCNDTAGYHFVAKCLFQCLKIQTLHIRIGRFEIRNHLKSMLCLNKVEHVHLHESKRLGDNRYLDWLAGFLDMQVSTRTKNANGVKAVPSLKTVNISFVTTGKSSTENVFNALKHQLTDLRQAPLFQLEFPSLETVCVFVREAEQQQQQQQPQEKFGTINLDSIEESTLQIRV